jgi:hypothetical protein
LTFHKIHSALARRQIIPMIGERLVSYYRCKQKMMSFKGQVSCSKMMLHRGKLTS